MIGFGQEESKLKKYDWFHRERIDWYWKKYFGLRDLIMKLDDLFRVGRMDIEENDWFLVEKKLKYYKAVHWKMSVGFG